MGLAWMPLLVALGGFPWACALRDVFTAPDGDIRDFTVAARWAYVVTDQHLYQLNLRLGLLHSLSQRGEYIKSNRSDVTGQFIRAVEGNATFRVNTLVPIVARNQLFTCGALVCGFCEMLDLANITSILNQEDIEVSPLVEKGASVGFMVDINGNSYILAAAKSEGTNSACPDYDKKFRIRLYNTDKSQFGGLLSNTDVKQPPDIFTRYDVQFVDGFQIKSTIFIFSNVIDEDGTKVRLLWFEAKDSKTETLRSMRGGTLSCCGKALVSSSVVTRAGTPLWAGVFAHSGSTNTELAVFDISLPTDQPTNTDPHFYYQARTEVREPSALKPRRVLLTRHFMTSVLAVELNNWVILFVGTGDGQLLKLTVDAQLQAHCLSTIWKAPDDRCVFPKMLLDPVGHKHVLVAFRNELKRVAVSQCGQHSSLESCWNAQDPYCGWCASQRRCSFEDECPSSLWLSVPDDPSQRRMLSHSFLEDGDGQIRLVVRTHLGTGASGGPANFSCRFVSSGGELAVLQQQYPECTCLLPPVNAGLRVSVTLSLGGAVLTQEMGLLNCSAITGPPDHAYLLCSRCLAAGCGWSQGACLWSRTGAMKMTVCLTLQTEVDSLPEIFNITPSSLSLYGKNHLLLSGQNLAHVVGVQLQGDMDCSPTEAPVLSNTGSRLSFHAPPGDKGRVRVCLLLPDGGCHGNASLTYRSAPVCTAVTPNSTWASGKRKMNIMVSNLEFVEEVAHSHTDQKVPFSRAPNGGSLQFESLATEGAPFSSSVTLRVANHTLACPTAIRYLPDPQFTGFIVAPTTGYLQLTITKSRDELQLAPADLQVRDMEDDTVHSCTIKSQSEGADIITCIVARSADAKITSVKITYGDKTVVLNVPSSLMWLVALVIPLIVAVAVGIFCCQKRSLTARMNRHMEDLEMDIRNDIRQGFVEMQMESSALMDNVGAIPFLDYKHFAAKIFFPEGGSLMTSCLRDIAQNPRTTVSPDESCRALAQLLREPLFLTSMVHALEEQKSFTIQNKCTVASVLTVALHQDLGYLTEVMEQLLQAAMEQPSNTQHKMLLRRTESIVEKILTNWMSVCLYGFIRESVGQRLFLLVSALTQQMAKGPVDSVTGKALYTLSEDWLLWQAQDFTAVKLQAVFVVGDDGQLSEPLEVTALSCDTVDQVKLKILEVFKAKFGFAYNIPLQDIRLELERDAGVFVALEEVDRSSEVTGEVTMLNTLRHYEVPDNATVKVLSTGCHPPMTSQCSVKDDQDFSTKYFHLIHPDVYEDQSKNPERKKFKLKEVHLTKLLSTKVAVHSYVVDLFHGIWGAAPGKAPAAIKHFFDFLDAQAARMKITDPDVLHIWKTNSLPLRFWVNILKNPQFVFDIEKSPHLDGCLSVITQAFMDSFSLSDTQLGKHAPTNKLLYARDIPQFKQEVKVYFKSVRDQQPLPTSEFKDFLQEESNKHHNEFNEGAALRELYKFIHRYFTEIVQRLERDEAPAELRERLQRVKDLFEGLKACPWE